MTVQVRRDADCRPVEKDRGEGDALTGVAVDDAALDLGGLGCSGKGRQQDDGYVGQHTFHFCKVREKNLFL